MVPAALVEQWIAAAAQAVQDFNELVQGTYLDRLLAWNMHAAPAAMQEYYDEQGAEPPPTWSYQQNRYDLIDGTDVLQSNGLPILETRPERPPVPEPPVPYSGPVIDMSPDAPSGSLRVTAGYGVPAIGRIQPSLGGKSFGVKGQGGADELQRSLTWPPQDLPDENGVTCENGFRDNFVVLSVRGKGQTQANRLVISV